ncbi:MAG: DoxX family protein [Gammaproteobacteria bacterium]|tara:strand:+ start:1123 stop:1551 length:429 start_codon:yes stop_codon:yes gene_type:complete
MKTLNNKLDAIAKPLLGITPWLLRLSLGVAFFLHGLGKLPLPPQRMVVAFESRGMPIPDILASAVSIGEMAAGIGIILGGFFSNHIGNLITRLSGGAVCVIMIGAFYLVHSEWFITTKLFQTEQIFLFTLGLYFAIRGNSKA